MFEFTLNENILISSFQTTYFSNKFYHPPHILQATPSTFFEFWGRSLSFGFGLVLGTFTVKLLIVNDLIFYFRCRLKLKSNMPSKSDSI